jgi:hypothetical protein
MIDTYGNDYLLCAFIAFVGLGALRPEDAIYPIATTYGEGKPLTGASRSVLPFDMGQTPPVDAFWSMPSGR